MVRSPRRFPNRNIGIDESTKCLKNSIIVPSGSKGGFVPKRIPVNGTRDEIMAEAKSNAIKILFEDYWI